MTSALDEFDEIVNSHIRELKQKAAELYARGRANGVNQHLYSMYMLNAIKENANNDSLSDSAFRQLVIDMVK